MRFHKYQILGAFALSLTVLATRAQAQINLPFGPENYQEDFQLFAPVEIDLDNEPYQDDFGFWADYSKLSWSFSGEHVRWAIQMSQCSRKIIYYANPDDIDLANRPDPYQIHNGLQNALPDAGFAFGDRYEVGYRNRGNGWMIGILDGPEQRQFKAYGMSPTLQGSSLPGTPPIDPSYVGPVAATGLYALGFGNVHVNFATSPGYLKGFRRLLEFSIRCANRYPSWTNCLRR